MTPRFLPRSPTAIDYEVMAGNVRSGIRQEKRDSPGNLFGFADAAEGRFFRQALHKLRMIALHDVFGKRTWRNAIRAHVLFAPMHRQVFRHLDYSGLGNA